MFERIIVPIDASGESLLALPVACRLAETSGARLCLLRVALAYELPPAGSSAPSGNTCPRIAAGTFCAAGPLAEEVILRAGRASEIPSAIVAEARTYAADLIVMATHARSGFDRLAHPSVAEAVLANTTVPLLLVNATRGQLEPDPASPVVAAVDGTPEGAAALPVAMQYARALDAEVLLLRIVAPELDDAQSPALRYDPAALADAQRYLDRLAAQVSDCGVPAQGRALFGPVAETLATVAEQVHAGAIALSTHGVQGAARLVRGSVADGLLRAESCPILLVRRDAATVPHPASASWGVPTAQQTADAGAARG
jgi:nucleotide-binding universal stress UspA family protein